MRARTILLPLFIIALGASARPARAQSLADVARKEGERRKEVKEPAKTFTNKDLPNAPAPSTSRAADAKNADQDNPSDGAKAKSDDPAAAKDVKDVKDAKDGKDSEDTKDEKYWGDKMKGLRDALDHDHFLADAIQTRIDALSTDFVNRDDPAQRSVIDQNRQKALDELDRLKKAIDNDSKAIDDLEEDARRAGVPSGWLR